MGPVPGNLGGEIFLLTVCWVGVSVSTGLAWHGLGQPVGCTHEPGSHGMWGYRTFCFFYDPKDVGNLISGFSAFSKTILNIRKFRVHILLNPGLENFEHYFSSV